MSFVKSEDCCLFASVVFIIHIIVLVALMPVVTIGAVNLLPLSAMERIMSIEIAKTADRNGPQCATNVQQERSASTRFGIC